MLTRMLALWVLAAALGGCAATRMDATVHTVGAWPEGRMPASFGFERLPSQQARVEEQDRLEAAALPALERAGFRLAKGEPPQVWVQVAERVLRGQAVYPDPFFGPYPYGDVMFPGRWRGAGWGWGWGWGFGGAYAVPYQVTEVSVLIRDARSNASLYESRASGVGSWSDDSTRAALFAAALKDFPYAAVSPRSVTVELPQ